jgi:hypothetical protein
MEMADKMNENKRCLNLIEIHKQEKEKGDENG